MTLRNFNTLWTTVISGLSCGLSTGLVLFYDLPWEIKAGMIVWILVFLVQLYITNRLREECDNLRSLIKILTETENHYRSN